MSPDRPDVIAGAVVMLAEREAHREDRARERAVRDAEYRRIAAAHPPMQGCSGPRRFAVSSGDINGR